MYVNLNDLDQKAFDYYDGPIMIMNSKASTHEKAMGHRSLSVGILTKMVTPFRAHNRARRAKSDRGSINRSGHRWRSYEIPLELGHATRGADVKDFPVLR